MFALLQKNIGAFFSCPEFEHFPRTAAPPCSPSTIIIIPLALPDPTHIKKKLAPHIYAASDRLSRIESFSSAHRPIHRHDTRNKKSRHLSQYRKTFIQLFFQISKSIQDRGFSHTISSISSLISIRMAFFSFSLFAIFFQNLLFALFFLFFAVSRSFRSC
jgi:hypothetical protein